MWHSLFSDQAFCRPGIGLAFYWDGSVFLWMGVAPVGLPIIGPAYFLSSFPSPMP